MNGKKLYDPVNDVPFSYCSVLFLESLQTSQRPKMACSPGLYPPVILATMSTCDVSNWVIIEAKISQFYPETIELTSIVAHLVTYVTAIRWLQPLLSASASSSDLQPRRVPLCVSRVIIHIKGAKCSVLAPSWLRQISCQNEGFFHPTFHNHGNRWLIIDPCKV